MGQKKTAIWGFLLFLVLLFNFTFTKQPLKAEEKLNKEKLVKEKLSIDSYTGRVLAYQIHPVFIPECLVTCNHKEGIGDDDIFTIPQCYSSLKEKCSQTNSDFTPALQMDIWISQANQEKAIKLMLITTHSLGGPFKMNMSTRYGELTLPNLITSIAEMQHQRKNMIAEFKTVHLEDVGNVIVSADIKPIHNITYVNQSYDQ